MNELSPYFEQRQPVYARLLDCTQALMDGDAAFARRLEDAWRGRRWNAIYDQPLLLIGALREDVLVAGHTHPLWAALRDEKPDAQAVTRDALAAAFEHERVWRTLTTRYVQTNETSRAVVWLWPATLLGERPFALVDCAASAGLNLVADALPAMWNVPVVRSPNTTLRLGLDARPIDVAADDDMRWLRACIWAGDHVRLTRFDVAVAAARANPPRLETLDALEFPRRIGELARDHFVLAYQSIFRDYLEPQKRREYLERMAATPALWIELEADDLNNRQFPCSIHAHHGGRSFMLARAGYHPIEVVIDRTAVEQLTRALNAR